MAITFLCALNQVKCERKTFTSGINKEFTEAILKPRVSTSTLLFCVGPGQVRHKRDRCVLTSVSPPKSETDFLMAYQEGVPLLPGRMRFIDMDNVSKRILESLIRVDALPCSHCSLTGECRVYKSTTPEERHQLRRTYNTTGSCNRTCLAMRLRKFCAEQRKGVDEYVPII